MSIPKITDTVKTVIAGAAVLLTVIGLWVGVNTTLSAMDIRVKNNTEQIQKLQEDNDELKKLLIDIQISQERGFGEIKVMLKDKADRE